MTGKSGMTYLAIGLLGIGLLIISKGFQGSVEQQEEVQLQALEKQVNPPREKLNIKKNDFAERIEDQQAFVENVQQEAAKKMRAEFIKKTKSQRDQFLERFKIDFPIENRAQYRYNGGDKSGNHTLVEIGQGGSYLLALTVYAKKSPEEVASNISTQMNVTTDDVKKVPITANASTGFVEPQLFEVETTTNYNLIFIGKHPANQQTVTLHFAINSMTKLIEDYINDRFRQLRAYR